MNERRVGAHRAESKPGKLSVASRAVLGAIGMGTIAANFLGGNATAKADEVTLPGGVTVPIDLPGEVAAPLQSVIDSHPAEAQAVINAIDALPEQPEPISIPNAVQDIMDPVFPPIVTTGYQALGYEMQLVMPEQQEFDPHDSLDRQLNDTVDLFLPEQLNPTMAACDTPDPEFRETAACAAAIVEKNNGTEELPPIYITGRYTPGMLYSIDPLCGQMLYNTSYSCGNIALSEPAGIFMGNDTVGALAGAIGHEYGHHKQNQEMIAQGSSLNEHMAQGSEHGFEAEQYGDYTAGTILGHAEEAGDLTPADTQDFRNFIARWSFDWDEIHGGPTVRDKKIVEGLEDGRAAYHNAQAVLGSDGDFRVILPEN